MNAIKVSAATIVVFCLSANADAAPSRWDVIRRPQSLRAQNLLDAADGARILADPALDGGALEQKLNERSALMIQLAGGEELGDPRLLYLLGHCLVHSSGQNQREGRQVLLRALAEDPDNPQAASAWFNIAIASSLLGDHVTEHRAYTGALEREWDPEARARIVLNRAESSMAVGDLSAAIADYRAAIMQTRSLVTVALAKWGLGVALDRSHDFPAAVPFLIEAAAMPFGSNGNKVAIDLDDVFFTPSYELHYYRALSQLALATHAEGSDATAFLLSSKLLWLNYFQAAPQDGPWVPRAQQHLRWINEELERRIGGD